MGRDLYDAEPAARDIFDRADAALGRAISKVCFDGPDSELGKTFNSQPAIYVMSIACLEAARAHWPVAEPLFVSGHSLGEYTALTAAGSIAFEDGVRLVETRGRLTQAAADAAGGGMAAVLGLDEAAAEAVCRETGAELCNINSPGQIVIGGATDALTRACALALERGAKRAITLDVGGAFHTSLMEPAVAGMTEALEAIEVRTPRVRVIANDSAAPMTEPARIRAELSFQLTHPVRWVQCVEYMVAQGAGTFVEFGPGRVLTGLIKRIERRVATENVNSAASVSR